MTAIQKVKAKIEARAKAPVAIAKGMVHKLPAAAPRVQPPIFKSTAPKSAVFQRIQQRIQQKQAAKPVVIPIIAPPTATAVVFTTAAKVQEESAKVAEQSKPIFTENSYSDEASEVDVQPEEKEEVTMNDEYADDGSSSDEGGYSDESSSDEGEFGEVPTTSPIVKIIGIGLLGYLGYQLFKK